MSDDHHLTRLRTLCREGDLEAADTLYHEALRRDLDADRHLAASVLFAAGRGRLEHAAEVRAIPNVYGEPPYRLTETHASDAFVAVVTGHEGYRSGYVVARLVLETLRECLEPDHTFDPDVVYADHDDHWRPLARAAAGVTRPLRRAASVRDRLEAALALAQRRLHAWIDERPHHDVVYSAELDVVAFELPRAVLAHIGLGEVWLHHEGVARCCTTRHDLTSLWRQQGFEPPNGARDWTMMPERTLTSAAARDGDPAAQLMRRVEWHELDLAFGDRLLVLGDPRRLELERDAIAACLAGATAAASLCEQLHELAARTPDLGWQVAAAAVTTTL